ncbi:MAG: peptide deformylase [Bacillus subtilis]|nr:peptide deformylase [Bacillus subtilis]
MLTMKDVIQEGHPVLRQRAQEVALPLSTTDLTTLRELMEYVENSQDVDKVAAGDFRSAVGIAAPQIGISKKMFVMKAEDETSETLHQYAVVNPKIIAFSEELTYLPGGEGCLSVEEEKNGLVPRSKRIKAKAQLVDLATGETKEVLFKLQGYVGIVFQHEYDHLLGVLFVDKVKESLPGIKPIEFPEDEE